MSIPVLRILTARSKLGFGKWHDLRISHILLLDGGIGYLRWCYFKIANISFADDVLGELYLSESTKIAKPGVISDEKWDEYGKYISDNTSEPEKKSRAKKIHKEHIRSLVYNKKFQAKILSKDYLRRKNHGH